MTYSKIWFSNKDRQTAALILTQEQFSNKTVSEISRLFPNYESSRMVNFHHMEFGSFEDAFNFKHGGRI
jgi:hypothetical protein